MIQVYKQRSKHKQLLSFHLNLNRVQGKFLNQKRIRLGEQLSQPPSREPKYIPKRSTISKIRGYKMCRLVVTFGTSHSSLLFLKLFLIVNSSRPCSFLVPSPTDWPPQSNAMLPHLCHFHLWLHWNVLEDLSTLGHIALANKPLE